MTGPETRVLLALAFAIICASAGPNRTVQLRYLHRGDVDWGFTVALHAKPLRGLGADIKHPH